MLAITPDYAVPFLEAAAEFRKYMTSKSWWEKTTPEQREGAKRALALSMLYSKDPKRDSVTYWSMLEEYGQRECYFVMRKLQEAATLPHTRAALDE